MDLPENRRFTCIRKGKSLSKTHFEMPRDSDKPAALFHGLTVRWHLMTANKRIIAKPCGS